MIFFHLLFANLLFIQSIPPPPPPGGSELQSVIVIRDLDGSDIENMEYKWWPMEKAILNPADCLGDTHYCDYWSILQGMENGNIRIKNRNDIWIMWKYANELFGVDAQERVCRLAASDKNPTSQNLSWQCRNFDLTVPIPIWSKLLLISSLIGLWLRYYKDRSIPTL